MKNAWSPKVKLLLDVGPLAMFFIGYRTAGLMAATGALIICTIISLLLIYWKEKKIAVMPLVSGIAVTVFGGMTLLLKDELFIKMKPTLVNLLFASILLGGVWFKKPFFKYLLDGVVQLTERGWMTLSCRWGFYFVFLAALNEVIWRHFSTDFWVNFKVFGMFTLTMLFTLAQLPLMKREMLPEETAG